MAVQLKWYKVLNANDLPSLSADEHAAKLDKKFHRKGDADPLVVGYVYADGFALAGWTHVSRATALSHLEDQRIEDASDWVDLIESRFGPSTDPP